MTYQMTITLSDDEYAHLAAEAAKTGKAIESVAHDLIAERIAPPEQPKRTMTSQEFVEKLYREGKILNIPTREPLTEEEKAERERLAQLFSGGKPLSEMVIEDRGPRQ